MEDLKERLGVANDFVHRKELSLDCHDPSQIELWFEANQDCGPTSLMKNKKWSDERECNHRKKLPNQSMAAPIQVPLALDTAMVSGVSIIWD